MWFVVCPSRQRARETDLWESGRGSPFFLLEGSKSVTYCGLPSPGEKRSVRRGQTLEEALSHFRRAGKAVDVRADPPCVCSEEMQVLLPSIPVEVFWGIVRNKGQVVGVKGPGADEATNFVRAHANSGGEVKDAVDLHPGIR